MAVGAAYLLEHLLATGHGGIVDIADGGDCQATVPYHEVGVFLVGHLDIEIPGVEVGQDTGLHISVPPFGMIVVGIDFRQVFVESGLHFGIFR